MLSTTPRPQCAPEPQEAPTPARKRQPFFEFEGLTYNERSVMEAIISLMLAEAISPPTVSEILEETDLKRSTIVATMESLQQKDMIRWPRHCRRSLAVNLNKLYISNLED